MKRTFLSLSLSRLQNLKASDTRLIRSNDVSCAVDVRPLKRCQGLTHVWAEQQCVISSDVVRKEPLFLDSHLRVTSLQQERKPIRLEKRTDVSITAPNTTMN